MADIKNFGIKGLAADVQMGKSGGRLKYDALNGRFDLTRSDGSTLEDLRVGTVKSGTWNGTSISTQYGGTGQDFSASTGVIKVTNGVASASAIDLGNTSFVSGIVGLANGGTGANTAPDARTNLGLGSIATQDANAVAITGGNIDGTIIGASTAANITGTSVTATTGFFGDLTGTAANATVLKTARYFSASGDATASGVSFDGSANVDLALTLANTGVTAGMYGNTTSIPTVVVDAKGRITSITTNAISTSFTIAGDSGSSNNIDGGETLTVSGGVGLTTTIGTNSITVDLDNTAVSAGTYGSATNIPQFTVDAQGRITSASNIAVATNFVISGDTGGTDTVNGGETLTVSGGTGLTTTISNNSITVDLDNTAVSAGTYGDSTNIPQFTVDGQGRITSASNVSISTSFGLAGDTGTDTFNNGGTLTVQGTANEIETAVTDDTITIGLVDNPIISGNLHANGSITADGDIQIDGNLTVGGNVVTLNVTNLAVEDNMIYLNANSNTANPDLGIVGNYNDGTYAHTGVFRDASDGRWKFFQGYVPEPDACVYIDTTNVTFQYANVQVDTLFGNVSGNISGSAGSLATTTYFSASGDATASGVSFNGTANVDLALTLANSGVTAGMYGNTSAIPTIVVDSKGRITSITTNAISTSFTIAGDVGTNDVVNGGETLTVAGGVGLTTTIGANQVTVDLDNTSVTAGAYGNTTNVATFTVDAQGRLTSAGTSAIAVAFTVAADSGNGSVTSGSGASTLTVAGGTGLTSSYSAGTVTVDLDNTAVSAASYGSSSSVATFTVDAQGRLTAASNVTIDITASQVSDFNSAIDSHLSGGTGITYSSGTITLANTAVSAGTYGDSTNIPQFTVDAQGRITSATNVSISTSFTISGDVGANDTVNTGEVLSFLGTGNQIQTTISNNSVTFALTPNVSITGSLTAGSLTDGTLTIDNGNITGGGAATFSGAVQGGSLTDGTATLSSGSLTGAVNGTFSGNVQFGTLTDGSISIVEFINDNTLATAAANNIATAASVKAYVDAQLGATMLDIAGDTGTGNVDLTGQTLTVQGTANEIETSVSGQTVTIGLPNDVTVGNNLTVTNNLSVTGSLLSNDITAATVNVNGDAVITGNLTVQGTQTIVDSTTVQTADAIFRVNSNGTTGANVGFEANVGGSMKQIVYTPSNTWSLGTEDLTLGDLTAVGGTFSSNVSVTGDVAFGTLTDTGNSITVTKFVNEADGIANNDNDTTIPTSAAVVDYVLNNGGDGLLLRNTFTANSSASSFTVGTVPNVSSRTYYADKIVIKVGTAFSGGSFNHIVVKENGGSGTVLVAADDADAATMGTYIIELTGDETLTKNAGVVVQFKQSDGTTAAVVTAGSMTATVHYKYV